MIDDRSNLIARVGGGGRRLLIVSHMDTVGVNGMTIPPFQPVVEDDCLYGRGSADTKGGMTASLLALERLHEAAEPLNGEVIFAATVDEEFEARGIERLVEEVEADGALVMEPVNMTAVIAHKGFAWLEFEVRGRAAHGSDVDLGIDAIAGVGNLLDGLKELDENLRRIKHQNLGSPSLHASRVWGGEGGPPTPLRAP